MSAASPILAIVKRIEHAQRELASGGNEDAVWFAGVVDQWIGGMRIEIAAGLYGGAWRSRAAEGRRNRAVARLASTHFGWVGHADAPRVGREIAQALADLAGRVPLNNREIEMLTSSPGSRRRALFEILAICPVGLSAKQVARVLRDTTGAWDVPAPRASSASNQDGDNASETNSEN